MSPNGDGEQDDESDGGGEAQGQKDHLPGGESNPETAVTDDFSERDLSVGEPVGGYGVLDIVVVQIEGRHLGGAPLEIFNLRIQPKAGLRVQ